MAKSDKPETAAVTTAAASAAVTVPTSDKPKAGEQGKFLVEFNGLSGRYEARDEAEAWALFNDAHKTSYGPKVNRKITRVE